MPKTPILLALLATMALAQDFSGTWKLTSQRAVSGVLPEPAAALLEIEQSAGRIRCTTSPPGSARQWQEFTLDGKASRSTLGTSSLNSIAKWEGTALLVNTIVASPSASYTQMDRWRVSSSRDKLTVVREIVGRTGSAEAQLVYERQDRASVPVQAPGPRVGETAPLTAAPPAAAPAHAASAPEAPSQRATLRLLRRPIPYVRAP